MKRSDAARKIRGWHAARRDVPPELRLATDRYRHALAGGLLKARTDGDQETQVANYTFAMASLSVVEAQVRQVLCGSGVPPALFLPYFSFSRQVYRLHRMFSGRVLVEVLRSVVDRWVCQGLRPEVLERILSSVFTLTGIGRPQQGEKPESGEPNECAGRTKAPEPASK